MNFEELKEQFLVDDQIVRDRLERLMEKALPHCAVHKNGTVEVRRSDLSGKDQVKVVLSARLIASKLDESLSSDVTVDQIAEYTGLPKNQATARAKECLDEKFAERTARGSYKARVRKVEEFFEELGQTKAARAS